MIFVIYKEKINTMKKSRIIIPALALIAFSVAASVTGAVAWFTASRTAQIDAGTYAVVKTSANLEVELTAGAHTSVNSGSSVVTVNGVLSDGSFDHTNGLVYTPSADGKSLLKDDTHDPVAISIDGEGYTDSADALLRGQTAATQGVSAKNIYTAVTFDVTFTVTFGSTSGDIALYLDNTVTRNDQNVITARKTNFRVSDNAEAKTAQGFRMAFYPIGTNATSGNKRVLADLQSLNESYQTNPGETPPEYDTRRAISYIGGDAPKTAFTNGGLAYADNVLIDENYEAALPTESTPRATAIARPDCLGIFTFDAGNRVQLSYRVVCWFEGTDPEIVNRRTLEEYQAVVATLNFEAIDLAAATTNP